MGIKVEGSHHHADAFILVLEPDGSRADVYLRGADGDDAIFLGKIEDESNHLHIIKHACKVLLSQCNRDAEAKLSKGPGF